MTIKSEPASERRGSLYYSTIILKNELTNNRLIEINQFNEVNLRILNRVNGFYIFQINIINI